MLKALIGNYPGIQFSETEIPRCQYCHRLKSPVAAGVNSIVYYCENKSCLNWHYPTEVEYEGGKTKW